MKQISRRVALPVALACLVFLAFWPGLGGGFLFDDYHSIVHQEKVHATQLDAKSIREAAGAYEGWPGRPIATVSFAINHAFSGLDPWSYKLVGLLVHIVNALLVFLLVRTILPLAGTRADSSTVPALAMALIWAVHPLQVSTVLYVVQRMETLSLTFVLCALLFYLRGRNLQMSGQRAWPWLVATVPLVLLGILSKESAVLFPAYALAVELTVLRFVCASPSASRLLKYAYASAALVALALYVLIVIPEHASADAYSLRDFSLGERLLTQLRVLPLYLSWIVLPQPASYSFYYDSYPASTGLLAPATTLIGAMALLFLASAAVLLRRRIPLFSLGVAWFFAAHFLTSNVVALELVFEHRNYFAILGIVLAVYALVAKLPASEIPRVRTLGLAVVVVGLLGLTMIRSAGWGNPLQLALELVARDPNSPRASTDLGEQYMLRAGRDTESPFYALAVAEFERGARIPGTSSSPEQSLILMAANSGQPDRDEWWDSIIRKLEQGTVGPQEVSMVTDFMAMRDRGVKFNDAKFADAYLVVVRKVRMPAAQYYALGLHALRHLKDEGLAVKLFYVAADNSLDNPAFIAGMVESLHNDGYTRPALLLAEHARSVANIRISNPDGSPQSRANSSPTPPTPSH